MGGGYMKNLKNLRLETHKTQQEVAYELDMPRTKYARYELQTAEPSIETLIKLADYFHTTIDALLGHEVPYLLDKSMLTPQQRSLIDLVIISNDRLCEKAEAYLSGLVEGEQNHTAMVNKFRGE